MKKALSFVILSVIILSSASAQSQWTFNSRAWSTNYWTSLIYGVARTTVEVITMENEGDGNKIIDFIIPSADLVFPVGIEKDGFGNPYDIRTPYYYAFGNPFKHLGDFAIGVDASWSPSVVGLYLGAYYKSQEIVFKPNDDHLRGFYFQPRAGIVLGRKQSTLEAGVFYDKLIGCGGTLNADKDWFSEGLGLDFALSYSITPKTRTLIQFSMPLHNFLNENSPSPYAVGKHRRVGYIMLTQRIAF